MYKVHPQQRCPLFFYAHFAIGRHVLTVEGANKRWGSNGDEL